MKKLSLVSVAVLLILGSVLLPGCLSDYEPPQIAGTWIIDTSRTSIYIDFTPGTADTHLELYEKVRDIIKPLRDDLKDPVKITLSPDSTYRFEHASGAMSAGRYEQYSNVVSFISLAYPNGLNGASDGTVFELYFVKNDILPQLFHLLALDPEEEETLRELITDAQGFTTYFR